ncbi:vWA domain-containing protein, partial [Hydrogenophaga sp. XSHU_21]
QAEQELKFDAAMSATDQQRLRHADFAGLSASEFRLVERLARDIPLPLPGVRGRRERPGARGAHIHWGRVLQSARQHGGEPMQVPRRERRQQPLPLLILVDISGSMERYARLLLAFLHQATRGVPRSAFAFGTALTDLRAAWLQVDADRMLDQCNAAIADFAGGTRLGEALAQLRARHARCLVGRRTVVLLITDGLDTGEPDRLAEELQWLKRHSRQLLWLNPLLRFDGYEPLARGASVLHRHANGMLAVHNLEHLQHLAQALADLLKTR